MKNSTCSRRKFAGGKRGTCTAIGRAGFNTLLPRSVSFVIGSKFTSSAEDKIFIECSKMKYILVTGGVISGIGKGVISSSIGALLKGCGLHVTSIKIDPYLNIDAGTFSPYEHGNLIHCFSSIGNYAAI